MIIFCGHLPEFVSTKYCKTHMVQNILFKPSPDWVRAEIVHKDETIYTIGNMNKEVHITMTDTADFKIALVVNNKLVTTSPTLFYVKIKLHMTNEDLKSNFDFINYKKDFITDY